MGFDSSYEDFCGIKCFLITEIVLSSFGAFCVNPQIQIAAHGVFRHSGTVVLNL